MLGVLVGTFAFSVSEYSTRSEDAASPLHCDAVSVQIHAKVSPWHKPWEVGIERPAMLMTFFSNDLGGCLTLRLVKS